MLVSGLVGLAAGAVLLLVGWLMLVVAAFRQGAWWGIGVLLLEPVKWAFVGRHWKHAKRGLIAYLSGHLVLIAGVILLAIATAGFANGLAPASPGKVAAAAAPQKRSQR